MIHFIISPFRAGSAISKLVKSISRIVYVIFVLILIWHGIPLIYRYVSTRCLTWNTTQLEEGRKRVPTFYALHATHLNLVLYQVAICVNAVAFGACEMVFSFSIWSAGVNLADLMQSLPLYLLSFHLELMMWTSFVPRI